MVLTSRVACCALIGVLSVMFSWSALAADANGGGGASGSPAIETVVVTAERREEALRDVPSTVYVVTGDSLAARGPITSTGDILATVPGVRFNDLSAPILSEISIRGSGTERATGADPSVGLFANGVYIGADGRNFNPLDYFDLDRAEILAGPQGALYGRNAEYGVVNLISQKPTFADAGYLDGVYTFETQNSRETAVVNHAFSDELAIRLGAELIQQQSGFVYNPDSNTYFDTTAGLLGRAQIRYAHDDLDVNLMIQHQQMQVPNQWSGYDVDPAHPIANFPLGFSQPRYVLGQNGLNYNRVNIDNAVLTTNYNFGWATLSSTTSFRDQGSVNDNGGNIDLATSAALQQAELTAVTNGKLTVAKARSIYPIGQALSDSTDNDFYEDLHLSGDALGGRLKWLAGGDFFYGHTLTTGSQQTNPCATSTNNQPFETGTAAAPGPFSGLCTGTPTNPMCDSFFQTYGKAGATTSGYTSCPNLTPASATPGDPFPFILAYPTIGKGVYTDISQWGYSSTTRGQYYSWAPYLSLAYDLWDGLNLAGDVRYTDDHKSASQDVYQLYYPGTRSYFLAGGQIPHQDYSYDHSNLSFTTTLSYHLPDLGFIPASWNDLLYFKFGTGYRAGGFNFGASPPTTACAKPPAAGPDLCFFDGAQIPTTVVKSATVSAFTPVMPSYGDETTQSYEVGFKGDVTDYLFVTLDGYFSMTWNALTAVGDGCTANNSCLAGNTNYTINGGTVRGSGVELAIDTASLDVFGGSLNMEAAGSDQTAVYARVPTLVTAGGATVAGLPIVGSEVAQTPHYLASLSLNYRHQLLYGASGFLNIVYNGQWGGVMDTVIYPPYNGVPSQWDLPSIQKINLRTGIDFESFEFSLLVNNLTNQTYKLAQFTQPAPAAQLPGQAGNLLYATDRWSLPRSFGVELSYRW